jgi:hypothetical protein
MYTEPTKLVTAVTALRDFTDYRPSVAAKARDAEQIAIATGRKSYKTRKGTAEAVWPLEL